MFLGDEGDSRPVAYVVVNHLLFEEDVELVGFPVVQWRTAGREVDRDVVDFAVHSVEGAADDTVDAVAVAEVFVEPCANQSLGGRQGAVGLVHIGVLRCWSLSTWDMYIAYRFGVREANADGVSVAFRFSPNPPKGCGYFGEERVETNSIEAVWP